MYIDCKYYTASVQLKVVPYSCSKANVEDTEALIICFDTENVSVTVLFSWIYSSASTLYC